MRRAAQILVGVLAACVLIRVIAWLIAPALPVLVVVTLVVAVAARVVGGPRFRGFDRFLKL